MSNQNKQIMDIDDRPKGRKGIEEMLNRLEKVENDDLPDDNKTSA